MKVVENTAERLVLVDRPWLLAGVIWLMGFGALYGGISGKGIGGIAERLLVLGLGAGTTGLAWWFFAFLTITFDRAAGVVIHQAHRITGTTERRIALETVLGVRIQAERSDGARTERLALETTEGAVPLELGFSGFGRGPLEVVINEWLTRPG